MSYQTGTGNTVQDFVTAMKDFAVTKGWTVNKFDTTNKVLFIEKGACHLVLAWDTSTTRTAYSGTTSGSNFVVQDHLVKASLCSSIDGSKTVYYGHPGSLVTSNNDGDTVYSNNLTGPFTSWHFFSDASGDYIHAVVQATSELYTHFGFGLVAQGDLTHSGVGYCYGALNTWWRDYWNDLDTNSSDYNQPALHEYPMIRGRENVYAPDALPAGFDVMSSNNAGVPPLYRAVNIPSSFYAAVGTISDCYMLDQLCTSVAPMWSGRTPFLGIPVMLDNVANTQLCVVGDYPDVRYLNMEGLVAGQELVLSGDTWKIFPVMRQYAWGQFAGQPSSGQLGIAFKKIA